MQVTERIRLTEIDNIDHIMRETLKSIEVNLTPPQVWLDTYLLSDYHEPYQAFNALQTIIKSIIVKQLSMARQTVPLAGQADAIVTHQSSIKDEYVHPDDLKTVLHLEIGNRKRTGGYPNLKLWSLLYHQYFVVHNLSIEDFATATQISSRHLGNYRRDGIELLIHQLIHQEEKIIRREEARYDFRSTSLAEDKADALIRIARVTRSMENEALALTQSGEAIRYALKKQLPRHYVKVAVLRTFILLQGDMNGVMEAAKFLSSVENESMIKLLPPSPDKSWILTKIHATWAHLWRRSGKLSDALSSANQAIDSLHRLSFADTELVKDTYLIGGLMRWASGDYDRAQDLLLHALDSGYEYVYDVHEMMGLVYWSQGDYKASEHQFCLAIKQAEQQEDKWHLANQYGNLGLVYLSRGQLQISQKHIIRHRTIAQELNSWKEFQRASSNLGLVLLHRKRFQDAKPLLDNAYEKYETMSAPQSFLIITATLSQYHTMVGEHDRALELAVSARSLAENLEGNDIATLLALRCLGGCESLDPLQRVHYLESALKLSGDRTFDIGACQLGLGILHPDRETRENYGQAGVQTLQSIGAGRWIKLYPNVYPHLPLMA